MYNVAFVNTEKCVAEKGCRLCIMYCPEADCIVMDKEKHKAFVRIEICKGCDLCMVVCTKQKAITMHPVDSAGKIDMKKMQQESAGLGQAYAG